MRRPALHHPHTTAAHTAGWSHPYAPNLFSPVFYNDGGDDPEPPTPADPPKPSPPATRTFTQDEVEKLAAKEKSQGKRAGATEALAQFAADNGFKNAEDAKAFIEAARKAQQDALSEEEKRRQELERREQELVAREAAAIARERNASRRAVLVGLGATGEDLEDAAALLRVPDDADEQTVQDAAAALKERRPELFGAARPAQPPAASAMPPAPGGSPAGGPPPRTPATRDDAKARARKRAEQMGFRRSDAA
jgi:hypothetical protein